MPRKRAAKPASPDQAKPFRRKEAPSPPSEPPEERGGSGKGVKRKRGEREGGGEGEDQPKPKQTRDDGLKEYIESKRDEEAQRARAEASRIYVEEVQRQVELREAQRRREAEERVRRERELEAQRVRDEDAERQQEEDERQARQEYHRQYSAYQARRAREYEESQRGETGYTYMPGNAYKDPEARIGRARMAWGRASAEYERQCGYRPLGEGFGAWERRIGEARERFERAEGVWNREREVHDAFMREMARWREEQTAQEAQEEMDRESAQQEELRREEERVRADNARREQEYNRQKQQNEAVWKTRWERYIAAWAKVASPQTIDWPVWTGKMAAVGKAGVEKFYTRCVLDREELVRVLKKERAKWHPDMVTKKVGKLEGEVAEKVTEVFQIVDKLFGEKTERAERSSGLAA